MQVANMARFGANVLVGFADYLRKLADTARAAGGLSRDATSACG